MYTPLYLPLLPLLLPLLTTAQQQPPPSNMTITVSSSPTCDSSSGVNFTLPLPYDVPLYNFDNDSMSLRSYTLSRDATLGEQLDFSGPTKGMGSLDGLPRQCTLFHETTSPDSNGNALRGGVCYGLLLGAAECLRFWQR